MSTRLPLEGIRVADFTWVWAGPFCTLQLAHLGAEVIRIETATRPCITRLLPPWPDNKSGLNRSGYFNQYNQGKRSLTLNLKQPEALTIAKQLVAKSDIVTENFAGGVMDRLGLGYEALKQLTPEIIMISLSGYGVTGPEKEYISYGPAQVPMSGMSSLTGYKGWRPMHVGISYGDPNGGLHGAFAVMCALMYRARTGKGQYIDLSQWETSTAMVAEGLLDYSMNGSQPERDGNRDSYMSPHGVFRCAGHDQWVSLAARSDDEWQRLCAIIGRPELATDPRFATLVARKQHEDELEAVISAWTLARSPQEVTEQLQAAQIPAAPSMSNKDLSTDPHLNSRSIFVHREHPEVGAQQHVGIPWQMSKTPLTVRHPAPTLGQDTDYVLREILGYSTTEIGALREQQVLS